MIAHSAQRPRPVEERATGNKPDPRQRLPLPLQPPFSPGKQYGHKRQGVGHLFEGDSEKEEADRAIQKAYTLLPEVSKEDEERSNVGDAAPDVAAILPNGEG